MLTSTQLPRRFGLAPSTLPMPWDGDALRRLAEVALHGGHFIAVSNCQPVSHEWAGGECVEVVPASGLVTPLEPVMLACGGTWVAHASGAADACRVDAHGGMTVRRGSGHHRLRRVWVDDAQQRGHRDGFSNAGLWPLCHHVQVRPVFDDKHWRPTEP